MSRNKGTFNISANFEPLVKAPFDGRNKVGLYSDLTDPSTWADTGGNIWLYDGLTVSVSNDIDSSKNGIYFLNNSTLYTDASQWKKISFSLDVSTTNNDLKSYIDSSLGVRDTSIAFLDSSKAYKSYVDASLNAKVDNLDASSYNFIVGKGKGALENNTSGYNNIAIGQNALKFNTTGFENIAIGSENMISNVTGDGNVTIGMRCMRNCSTGFDNVAIGFNSLDLNIGGDENLAIGTATLMNSQNGNNNVAIGRGAGNQCDGSNNIFIGNSAGYYLGFVDYRLVINSIDRGSAEVDASMSIIYGIQDYSIANQILNINGQLKVNGYIQTNNNIKFLNGSNTGTLKYIPTSERTITFPDSSGTLSLTSYVDSSLNARDTSIAWLNTNKADASSLTLYLKEASIGSGLAWNAGLLDVSISGITETLMNESHYYRQSLGIDTSGDVRMYVSLSGKYTQQYDGSSWIDKEIILW